MDKSFWLCLLFLLAATGTAEADVTIEYDSSSIANASTIAWNTSSLINFSVTNTTPIDTFKVSWNGSMYPIYDSSLLLSYHFNNGSEMTDDSKYAHVLTATNITTVTGKYETGLFFNGTSGSKLSVVAPATLKPTKQVSMSFWAKPVAYKDSSSAGSQIGFCSSCGYSFWQWASGGAHNTYVWELNYTNGTRRYLEVGIEWLPKDVWTFVVLTADTQLGTLKAYKNGELSSEKSIATGDIGYPGVTFGVGQEFNGTLDELKIWNRSLDETEARLLYGNSGKYWINSTQIRTETYNYYGLINDTFGSQVQSQTRTLTVTARKVNVTANFSRAIGVISNDFYGTNTHGKWGSNWSFIDTDANGVYDTYSNYTWHREKLLEAGIRMMRADMYLENVYFGADNKEVEQWNVTKCATDVGTCENVPMGWRASDAGSQYGNVSRSTEAHSGQYSVNITDFNGTVSGATFNIQYPGVLEVGVNYTLSVWVRPDVGQGQLSMQRLDTYATVCTDLSDVSTGTWEKLTCSFVVNESVSAGWTYLIQTSGTPAASFLWDDFSVTKSNGLWKRSPLNTSYENIERDINLVKWAYDAGIQINYIISYMPTELANRTMYCTSNVNRCGPFNNTEYANAVLDFVNTITLNGAYASAIVLEVWNEPAPGFWLPDLPANNTTRSILYNAMYIEIYDIIKTNYPTMLVGGSSDYSTEHQMYQGLLAAYPTKVDFIAYHPYYGGTTSYASTISAAYSWLWAKVSYYNSTLSKIYFDEWMPSMAAVQVNQSEIYKILLAEAYMEVLNTYPANTSMQQYQWAEYINYTQGGTAYYPEFPNRWSMVAEPQLENALYMPFNITKQFSTYHSIGSTIINTNTSNSNIQTLASKKAEKKYVTVLNKYNDTANISLLLVESGKADRTIVVNDLAPYEIRTIDVTDWTISEPFSIDYSYEPAGFIGGTSATVVSLIPVLFALILIIIFKDKIGL